MDDFCDTSREASVHAESRVCPGQKFFDEDRQCLWSALTAVFRIDADAFEARFVHLKESGFEAFRRDDFAVFEFATLAVADGIDRSEHVAGEFVGLVENHGGFVEAPGFEGWFFEQLAEFELIKEEKLQLAQVGSIAILIGLRVRQGASSAPPLIRQGGQLRIVRAI